MTGPYQGVRVLELGGDMATSFAGMLLADRGADVIKYEPPAGDELRSQGAHSPGESKIFQWLGRGKRSVALDTLTVGGRAALIAIAHSVDVLITSWPAGALGDLELDAATLCAARPALVFVWNQQFGSVGAWSDRASNELVLQAYSGLMAAEGKVRDDGATPEQLTSTQVVALPTGILMSMAVATGLWQRIATGRGQRIDVSELQTALCVQVSRVVDNPAADKLRAAAQARIAALRGQHAPHAALQAARTEAVGAPGNIFYRAFRTSDGAIFVGALSRPLRDKVRRVFDTDFLYRDDPRFDLQNPEYVAQCVAAEQRIEALLRTRPSALWLAALEAGGVPCGDVQFAEDLADSEHARANDYFVALVHGTDGRQLQAATPARFSGWPAPTYAPAPAHGEHTAVVLAEIDVRLTAAVGVQRDAPAGPMVSLDKTTGALPGGGSSDSQGAIEVPPGSTPHGPTVPRG